MKYKFQLIVSVFIFVYLLISALVLNFYNNLAMKDAKKEAYYVLESINSVREYIAGVQRPLIEQLKHEGIIKEDFFDERLLSSSYISREIYNIQKKKYNLDFDYKLVAMAPLNKAHEPNEFEAQVLRGFKENKFSEFSKIIKDENGSQFFVGLPIRSQNTSCLACHNSESAPKQMLDRYEISNGKISEASEMMAMLSFKIPLRAIFSYHLKEVVIIMSAIAFVFGIFLLLVYKMHRRGEESKRQTEQLMIHQSRLASMGEMIGNISHQWKQPLAQISSALINLELYQERKKLDEAKIYEFIEETSKQINFMSETVDDFKNFFKPNTLKREFNVEEVINQTIKILNASLKKYQIEIEIDIRENFTIFANFNEIIQILINIINNAKDAFKQSYVKPRVIKIYTFIKDNRKNLCVQNNAGAIKASFLKVIFEPHFSTKESGSGLGLYMSRLIASKNNALIFARNVDENSITFTISFENL
ncbi:c-type heme family protein [Campylobacter concisus]